MKNILCYGDSNTWGLIPGTQNRFPQNVRWTGLLQEKLKTKGIQILEEGLCGRTTIFEDSLQYIPAENILVVSPIYLGESVWKPQYDPEFDEVSVETSKQLHAEYQKAAHRKNVRIIAASDFVKASEIDQEHPKNIPFLCSHWICKIPDGFSLANFFSRFYNHFMVNKTEIYLFHIRQ